jgi:glycosyltransferase involved in cell wall biosynthesis
MTTIAFVDTLGLTYAGETLNRRGLGGSESAVISMSRELANLGYTVHVFNDCMSDDCAPGIYSGVHYEPISSISKYKSGFDIFIASRSVVSFVPDHMKHQFKWADKLPNLEEVAMASRNRILWMHDTFCDGDNYIEELVTTGRIHKIFTLSDWHTAYVTNCHHGKRRHYETLKKHIFQTRNGINLYHDEVDIGLKDPDLFVFNASVTKGMVPLLERIWPRVKKEYPRAKLTVVGGFYRFRSDQGPDAQELKHRELVEKCKDLDITFTGIIKQSEIADILVKASYMIYPSAFPETFGISTLEALAYNVPIITCNNGALEETAIDIASYKMTYSIEPNVLFTEIDIEKQCDIFFNLVKYAYEVKYLHQQKMYACNQVKSVCEWSTVALEWKRLFCDMTDTYMPVFEYREYLSINEDVQRIFGRINNTRKTLKVTTRTEPKIAVIMPVYNAEKYIARAIESVLAQDYDNYKLYVIDDASTDSTSEIIKKYKSDVHVQILQRNKNHGAVFNQISTIKSYCYPDDIIMLIDGDDWLVNDPHVFHRVVKEYEHEWNPAEFTYGSSWSLVDSIPLISQPYPEEVKQNKDYRKYSFNWGMPYTHLRTFKAKLLLNVDDNVFKDENGDWYKAGGDNAVFYTAIENADPDRVVCIPEILYVYNDTNPLNDYKVNSGEQTKNACQIKRKSNLSDKFSVIVPTMWRCKELFESMLERLVEHELVGEILIYNNHEFDRPKWKVFQNVKIKNCKPGIESKNYFVNPCWNDGVKKARYDKICLMNDDVLFDTALFDRIDVSPTKGVYGLITGEEKFGHPQYTDGSISFKKWNEGDIIHGFGQLMLLHKSNWTPIIDGLDIYYGDDFIFQTQLIKGLNNYMIYNIDFESPMAATSSDQSIVAGFYDREKPIFSEWAKANPWKKTSIQTLKDNRNKRILIAIPTAKYIEPETFKSVYDLRIPDGYEVDFQFFYGYMIDQIRNLAADWVVKAYDYLFFVDSDITFNSDTLYKLLEHDKPVVGGLYRQRKDEFILEVYDRNYRNINGQDLSQNALSEVGALGCGCILIKKEVLVDVGFPQFVYKSGLTMNDTFSEDVYFCKAAREKGYSVWIDTTILCGHKGTTWFNVYPAKNT